MSLALPPDIQNRVQSYLASGRFAKEEDVLHEALNALEREESELELDDGEEFEDDWPAIKEALDGIEAGTNKPMTVEEAFDQIRKRHGLA